MRFQDIEESMMCIQVCVAIHNYIVMTNREELMEVPESFEVSADSNTENQDEEEVEEEEEEEVAGFDQEIGQSTSEKIMRKYFLNR